ncbi:class IIb bacteriocin, lactobin A/cerein 7B family [Ruminococcus sp.]|jgi:lactobin A/cerein 7B family class IIb bacteriocin|nr:class IIb bacteriocin, lactobin A/cerein 7B family [Ruminococcus sp.]
MANFTELNSKEMNETNGGFLPIIIAIGAGVAGAAYAAYQASHK